MKDGLDLGIISSGVLVKKGYSFLIANVGKAVAVITLVVATLVSLTEISFSDFGGETFTSTLIMMLLASYIMYFSLEDAGEKLGRESDGYKAVSEKYITVSAKISGKDITALRQFCLDYRNADLEYRRSNMLFSLGYTEEEYARYLSGESLGKKAKKALERVKKIRRAELDAAGLLSKSCKGEGELKDPKSYKLINMAIRLIPSTVCMIFTVSVMISTRDNMTAAGIIEAILKLSTLPAIGLKGYAAGYQYATESEQGWIEVKTRILDSFVSNKNKM
jgi:hypothetical protein